MFGFVDKLKKLVSKKPDKQTKHLVEDSKQQLYAAKIRLKGLLAETANIIKLSGLLLENFDMTLVERLTSRLQKKVAEKAQLLVLIEKDEKLSIDTHSLKLNQEIYQYYVKKGSGIPTHVIRNYHQSTNAAQQLKINKSKLIQVEMDIKNTINDLEWSTVIRDFLMYSKAVDSLIYQNSNMQSSILKHTIAEVSKISQYISKKTGITHTKQNKVWLDLRKEAVNKVKTAGEVFDDTRIRGAVHNVTNASERQSFADILDSEQIVRDAIRKGSEVRPTAKV